MPTPGTYLTRRLLASWHIPSWILTYYRWANTPDHDTLGGLRHGLARMTIQDPGRTTAIGHNVNIADPIRGFFCTTYAAADPSAIAGASLAA